MIDRVLDVKIVRESRRADQVAEEDGEDSLPCTGAPALVPFDPVAVASDALHGSPERDVDAGEVLPA